MKASFHVWICEKKDTGASKIKSWRKSPRIEVNIPVEVRNSPSKYFFGSEAFRQKIKEYGLPDSISAEIEVEARTNLHGSIQFDVTLVNTSIADSPETTNGRLFESALEILNLDTKPFLLEALPDSFRYDRHVPAWGLNCGVEKADGVLRIKEVPSYSRSRPIYWGGDGVEPDLSFVAFEKNPLEPSQKLVEAFEKWSDREWSIHALNQRAALENWSDDMRAEAEISRCLFEEERKRLRHGIDLLRQNDSLRLAFANMNKAMSISARGKYNGWRSFQMGFLLSNLSSIVETKEEADNVDVVWFATGGGKTETYLGLLVTAALMDRMTGKANCTGLKTLVPSVLLYSGFRTKTPQPKSPKGVGRTFG